MPEASHLCKSELQRVKSLLDAKFHEFNNKRFIDDDPIGVPHRFTRKEDIEIVAFWTAILSWGLRKTIISKSTELFERMDNEPFQFIVNGSEKEMGKLESFVHRTFQGTDALYFLSFFKRHYSQYSSLEAAFLKDKTAFIDIKSSLIDFQNYFFESPWAPARTFKHVSSPSKGSTCKRILMFLRWMVRKDDKGVDFGLWSKIPISALYIPFDVHVAKVSRELNLIHRKQNDWKAVEELTSLLRRMDSEDPVKYDYALFGLGIEKRYGFL
jgi:uncharacterized protein (TIGR02757 family)